MHAIITDRYVAGVFERVSDAMAYLLTLPEDIKASAFHRLTGVSQYPVYILEDGVGFRFMDEVGLLEALAHERPLLQGGFEKGDGPTLTVYRLDQDYRPTVVGTDEMGTLDHEHLDRADLDSIAANGRTALRMLTRKKRVSHGWACRTLVDGAADETSVYGPFETLQDLLDDTLPELDSRELLTIQTERAISFQGDRRVQMGCDRIEVYEVRPSGFKWTDNLGLAESLMGRSDDQASLRTAIVLSYLALYNTLCGHLRERGILVIAEDERATWAKLGRQFDASYVERGQHLRMLAYRCDHDADLDFDVASKARFAINEARALLAAL